MPRMPRMPSFRQLQKRALESRSHVELQNRWLCVCVDVCVCVCVCVFARVVCVYLLFYFPVWRIGLRTSRLQTNQRSVQCTSAGQKFSDSCGGIRPKLGGIKNIVKTVSEELVPRNKHILLIQNGRSRIVSKVTSLFLLSHFFVCALSALMPYVRILWG